MTQRTNIITNARLDKFDKRVHLFVKSLQQKFTDEVNFSVESSGKEIYYEIINVNYDEEKLDGESLIRFGEKISAIGEIYGIYDIKTSVNSCKHLDIALPGNVEITFKLDII